VTHTTQHYEAEHKNFQTYTKR